MQKGISTNHAHLCKCDKAAERHGHYRRFIAHVSQRDCSEAGTYRACTVREKLREEVICEQFPSV